MKILCAWCGAVIRAEGGTMRLVSHGICQGCSAHEMAKINLTNDEPCGDKARQEVNPQKKLRITGLQQVITKHQGGNGYENF